MADFLYGQLNKTIEYFRYKPGNTHTASISEGSDHSLYVDVRPEGLVTLRRVKKDNDILDDQIQYYALYGYNSITDSYDIQLGEEIKVDTSIVGPDKIEKAYVKVGEEPIYNDDGSPVIDPETGLQMVKPIYEEVPISVTGQIVIQQIPASVITQTQDFKLDANGEGEPY